LLYLHLIIINIRKIRIFFIIIELLFTLSLIKALIGLAEFPGLSFEARA